MSFAKASGVELRFAAIWCAVYVMETDRSVVPRVRRHGSIGRETLSQEMRVFDEATVETRPSTSPDFSAGAAAEATSGAGELPAQGADPQRIPLPEAANPLRIYWSYLIPLTVLHLLALLAFVPWLFSWSGLVVAVLGHLTFGMLGITIGYHRLLTHRGFTCPRWLEHTFAVFGMCNLQDSPARWVAIHRMHHQHSDQQPDPHSPLANFLWAHVGWVVCRNRDHDHVHYFERYVRDLLRDPFYLNLERRYRWLMIYIGHAMVMTALGGLWGWMVGGTGSEALRMAGSWFVWGVVVRTVFVLHGTWAVNSLSHVFGYRNYETRDLSRNNWLVALLAHGEGWHNNHHAAPRAARHGHRWYELDMSWWVILGMERIGLAKDVVRPK